MEQALALSMASAGPDAQEPANDQRRADQPASSSARDREDQGQEMQGQAVKSQSKKVRGSPLVQGMPLGVAFVTLQSGILQRCNKECSTLDGHICSARGLLVDMWQIMIRALRLAFSKGFQDNCKSIA